MADRKQYGSSYIPDCPLCQGTNGGHYQTCPSYGGEKADERGSAEPHPPWCSGGCCNPDSAQARDAAQAVELTDEDRQRYWRQAEATWGDAAGGPLPHMIYARLIERAVLAKNGLGGKQ